MTDTVDNPVFDMKQMNDLMRKWYPKLLSKGDEVADVDKAGTLHTQNMKNNGVHTISEEYENTMISGNSNGAPFCECHYFRNLDDLSNDHTVFCVVGNSNKVEMMKRGYNSVTVHHINEAGQLPPSLISSIPAGGSSSNNDVTGPPHSETTANASAASNSHTNPPTVPPSPTGQHSPTGQSSQPSPTASSMGSTPQEPQAPPHGSQEPQPLNGATPLTLPDFKACRPDEDPCDVLKRWFHNKVSEVLPAYRTWTDVQHGIYLQTFKNRIMSYAQSYIYIMCHEDEDHSLVKSYTALQKKAKHWLTSLKANGRGGFTVSQYNSALTHFEGSYFQKACAIANHAVGRSRDS